MSGPVEPQPEALRNLPLTDRLRIDNSSALARKNLADWRAAKEARNGGLTLFVVCGDSRIVTADIAGDNKIVSISSIASSGDLKPFEKLLQHPAVGRIIVVGHFDHERINPDGKLGGCGGVDASVKIAAGKVVVEGKELSEFITQKITPNFFKNVKRTVEQASLSSGKPVLGVLVDHLTDAAFPIIEYRNGKETMYPEHDLERFQWKKIEDIQKFIEVYGDEFPQLKIDDLLPEFKKFILKNRKKASERLRRDPKFVERQKVQNPSTVVISTCPIPVALRYPDTFGRPNEAFVIRKAFDKEDKVEGEIRETDMDFEAIVGQLYYPLKQAGFPRTNSILIETPNMEMSENIAARLSKIDFVREWMENKQGRFIVGRLESHKTEELKYYQ